MKREDADVYCFQETKAHPEQLSKVEWPSGYHAFWCSAEKRGYSGTAIFTKRMPLSMTNGLNAPKHDLEGRVMTAEYEGFYLVNVYTPNAQRELARLPYRVEEWDTAFRRYIQGIARSKPVVICGDLNVAHKEIDLANPKTNLRNAGFTEEERNSFSKLLECDLLDTFRLFESGGGHYTWWSYRSQARQRNIGWRIDYFLASSGLRERVLKSYILPEITGSDHCPIGIVLDMSNG